jgi:chemotaxis protein CheD
MPIDLRIAELAVTESNETIRIYGLGSCIAVILHDPVARVTGAGHILLPSSPDGPPTRRRAKYADTAIRTMVKEMKNRGARTARMIAKLAGGAHMFSFASPREGVKLIGERNVLRAREILREIGIPVVAEDTGEDYGRTVEIDASTGQVLIRSINREERRI